MKPRTLAFLIGFVVVALVVKRLLNGTWEPVAALFGLMLFGLAWLAVRLMI